MSFQWNLAASEFTPIFSPGLNAGANEFNPFSSFSVLAVTAPDFVPEMSKEELEKAAASLVPIPVPEVLPEVINPSTEAVPAPALPVPAELKPDSIVVPQPEIKPQTENTHKRYSKELILSLKGMCKALPPSATIPEGYGLNDKSDRSFKGKKKNNKGRNYHPNPSDPPVVLLQSDDSFAKKAKGLKSEDEKIVNKLRFTLNRLSDLNFDKLSLQLLTEFTFEGTLLARLVQFIFELATAHHNYSQLYARLCALIRKKFWDLGNKALSKEFRACLLAKCESCFYSQDEPLHDSELMDAEFKRKRRLMGNIKFIGLLFKEKFIKTPIMHECFTVLLNDKEICDESVETFCNLFMQVAPEMPDQTPDPFAELRELESFYEKAVALRTDSRLTKRTHFLIQDLVDDKHKLLSLKVKGHKHTAPKRSPDSFSSPSKPVESPKPKDESNYKDEDSPARLSQVATARKTQVHAVIRHFAGNPNIEESAAALHRILDDGEINGEEIVHQILKYTLCDLSEDVHKSVCTLISTSFPSDAYPGFSQTIQGAKDLELDCPLAGNFLQTMIEEMREKDVLTIDQFERLKNTLQTAIADSPLSSPTKNPPPVATVLNFEEVDEKIPSSTNGIIRNFVSTLSVSETITSLTEALGDSHIPFPDVIDQAFKYTLLELSVNDIPALCSLVAELVRQGVGTADSVKTGLEQTIAGMEEIVLDCPKAQKYLREAIEVLAGLEAVKDGDGLVALLPA